MKHYQTAPPSLSFMYFLKQSQESTLREGNIFPPTYHQIKLSSLTIIHSHECASSETEHKGSFVTVVRVFSLLSLSRCMWSVVRRERPQVRNFLILSSLFKLSKVCCQQILLLQFVSVVRDSWSPAVRGSWQCFTAEFSATAPLLTAFVLILRDRRSFSVDFLPSLPPPPPRQTKY